MDKWCKATFFNICLEEETNTVSDDLKVRTFLFWGELFLLITIKKNE